MLANTVQLEDKTEAEVQEACDFTIEDEDRRVDIILAFRD